MAKSSAFLDKLRKQRAEERKAEQHFLMQIFFDLFAIEMRENRISEEKCRDILGCVEKTYGEFCDIWNQDSKDREYTFEKLDAKLKQLFPKYFMPWEQRYADFEISRGKRI